jgi:hypothetical protein
MLVFFKTNLVYFENLVIYRSSRGQIQPIKDNKFFICSFVFPPKVSKSIRSELAFTGLEIVSRAVRIGQVFALCGRQERVKDS